MKTFLQRICSSPGNKDAMRMMFCRLLTPLRVFWNLEDVRGKGVDCLESQTARSPKRASGLGFEKRRRRLLTNFGVRVKLVDVLG